MKKICVITTCRADFGYLYFIMKDIESSPALQLQIILPLNHHNVDSILTEFDCTYLTSPIKSIKDYGQFYSDCLKIMTDTHFDVVVLLGDRFETLAAATAALLTNTKIAHIAGGECTRGAFDDGIRNSITMLADYHFTSTWEYASNVARMKDLCTPDHYNCFYKVNDIAGNSPWKWEGHIYNVGSTGLDWLHRAKLLSKQKLQQCVGIDLNQPFIVACFHPVTKELNRTGEYIRELSTALYKNGGQVLWIKSNIDPEHDIINEWVEYVCKSYGWQLIDNLDHLTYLSLLQYTSMMIGNSSSGIIESSSFNIPSISVGNRQEGRIRGSNVFSCPCETEAILNAVDRAREWNALVGKCENPYGDSRSSERIVKILEGI